MLLMHTIAGAQRERSWNGRRRSRQRRRGMEPAPQSGSCKGRGRMLVTRSLRFQVCAVCLLAALPVTAAAAWPERAVTLVHGFGGGGNIDTISRIVAERLSVRLGQPVVVEARAGA